MNVASDLDVEELYRRTQEIYRQTELVFAAYQRQPTFALRRLHNSLAIEMRDAVAEFVAAARPKR
jgi:hypothetical protein